MAPVARNHARKHCSGDEHRSDRVDVYGSYDFVCCLLIECLVAGYDTRAVDKDVDFAALADYLVVAFDYKLISGYIYNISLYLSYLAELADCCRYSLRVDVPDDEAGSPFLKSHTAHDLSDSGSSSGDQYVCIFKFHNHLFPTKL